MIIADASCRSKHPSTNLLRFLLLRRILPVVRPLNLHNHLIDVLILLVPRRLAHLELLAEQLIVRLPVAPPEAVPQRGKLPVVEVEVQVVHGVARCAVDDRIISHVLAVVDQDGPDVDEDEEEDVGKFLQGK